MKKSCCCCISTILILAIALVGLFFGGTFYAYKTFAQPITGISYGQAIGLVPGLYSVNEKKIITNPFNQVADLNSFDGKMKEALFLKPESSFGVGDIVSELLKPKTQSLTSTVASNADETVNGSDNMFLELLKGLDFDFASLTNYDDMVDSDKKAKGVVSVTDKEVASIVGRAFGEFIDSNSKISGIMGENKASEIIMVKQVIVENSDDNLPEDTRIRATIGIDLKKMIASVIKKLSKNAFLTSLATAVMPQKIFIEMIIAPYNLSAIPVVKVNNYDEKKNETLMRLITNIYDNGITKKEGSFLEMFSSVDGLIKSTFAKITELVDMKFSGKDVTMDAVYTLMRAMKLNTSKDDFLRMISYLQTRDLSGLAAIGYDSGEIDTFISSFKTKYAVKDGFEINKANFSEKAGEVHKNLDPTKINFDKTNNDMKSVMSYDSLLSLMQQEIDKSDTSAQPNALSAKAGGKLSIFKAVKIKSISMVQGKETEERVRIIVEVGLHSMLTTAITNPIFLHLATEILPEKMYLNIELSLNCDMIKNADGTLTPKYPTNPTMTVNDLDLEQSINLFKTIGEMTKTVGDENLSKQLEYDTLKVDIATKTRDSIAKLENQVSGKMNVFFTKEGLSIPTIYELMVTMFKINREGEDPTDEMADDVRLIIKGLQESEKTKFNSNLLYQSTEAHNQLVLAKLPPEDNITMDSALEEEIDGVMYNYIEAEVDMTLFDKVLNYQFGDPIAAQGAMLNIKQTMFIDTTLQRKSVIMNEPFFENLIANSGMSGKLVIQTADVNISGLISEKNPLIPESLYLTYIFSVTADGKIGSLKVVANSLVQGEGEEDKTAIIEKIITNIQNKTFSFQSIMQDAITQSIGEDIVININNQRLTIAGETFDFKFRPFNISIQKMIAASTTEHILPGEDNDTLGTAYFISKFTQKVYCTIT